MGAMQFECTGVGKNAQEAFNNAVKEAQYEYGHGGYTGTIAEKHDFKVIPCKRDKEAIVEKMNKCMDNINHFVNDKWGPSGCIQVSDDTWVFFGTASS